MIVFLIYRYIQSNIYNFQIKMVFDSTDELCLVIVDTGYTVCVYIVHRLMLDSTDELCLVIVDT